MIKALGPPRLSPDPNLKLQKDPSNPKILLNRKEESEPDTLNPQLCHWGFPGIASCSGLRRLDFGAQFGTWVKLRGGGGDHDMMMR